MKQIIAKNQVTSTPFIFKTTSKEAQCDESNRETQTNGRKNILRIVVDVHKLSCSHRLQTKMLKEVYALTRLSSKRCRFHSWSVFASNFAVGFYGQCSRTFLTTTSGGGP
jgi:hypothetical protein